MGTTLAMRGKYGEALPVLKKAEQSCSESVLDDGGTEEEAKEEAAIIRFEFCCNSLRHSVQTFVCFIGHYLSLPSMHA